MAGTTGYTSEANLVYYEDVFTWPSSHTLANWAGSSKFFRDANIIDDVNSLGPFSETANLYSNIVVKDKKARQQQTPGAPNIEEVNMEIQVDEQNTKMKTLRSAATSYETTLGVLKHNGTVPADGDIDSATDISVKAVKVRKASVSEDLGVGDASKLTLTWTIVDETPWIDSDST